MAAEGTRAEDAAEVEVFLVSECPRTSLLLMLTPFTFERIVFSCRHHMCEEEQEEEEEEESQRGAWSGRH